MQHINWDGWCLGNLLCLTCPTGEEPHPLSWVCSLAGQFEKRPHIVFKPSTTNLPNCSYSLLLFCVVINLISVLVCPWWLHMLSMFSRSVFMTFLPGWKKSVNATADFFRLVILFYHLFISHIRIKLVAWKPALLKQYALVSFVNCMLLPHSKRLQFLLPPMQLMSSALLLLCISL